jgi:hypothetical protein
MNCVIHDSGGGDGGLPQAFALPLNLDVPVMAMKTLVS